MRRARHPTFGPTEKERLLEAMREARRLAILYGASEGYGSEPHKLAGALHSAIDKLAGNLTGDPEFYWVKPHRTS